MKNIINTSIKIFCSILLFQASLVVKTAHSEDTEENNPLRFYKGANNSYLQATLQIDFALFNQGSSWFGNSKEILRGDETKFWWESLVRPGIEGTFTLNSKQQKLYGRIDAVQANSGAELDADGTNQGLGAVSYLSIDNAYAGWRSGNLFSSFGEDFLDISFGRQAYQAGTGFLFQSEGGSGYNRAAWFLGGRRSAEYMGIVRLKSGEWASDLLYLKTDEVKRTNTKVGGATVDYTSEKKIGNFGGGFYAIESADPDRPARDGMKVYDIRGGIKPFELLGNAAALKPLKFEGEYAYEEKPKNVTGAGNGWYLSATYEFDQLPWTPSLTYRYASFDENFDPLFYAGTDWGYWFQGEIIGEYVLCNTNLETNMLRLKLKPVEPVTLNFFYYRYNLHDIAAFNRLNNLASPVTSAHYADSFDMMIDWTVNPHLSLALVCAYALPGDGASQHTGGKDNWSYMMLAGSIKF